MKILIACEFSGVVRDAFLEKDMMRYRVINYSQKDLDHIIKGMYLT